MAAPSLDSRCKRPAACRCSFTPRLTATPTPGILSDTPVLALRSAPFLTGTSSPHEHEPAASTCRCICNSSVTGCARPTARRRALECHQNDQAGAAARAHTPPPASRHRLPLSASAACPHRRRAAAGALRMCQLCHVRMCPCLTIAALQLHPQPPLPSPITFFNCHRCVNPRCAFGAAAMGCVSACYAASRSSECQNFSRVVQNGAGDVLFRVS